MIKSYLQAFDLWNSIENNIDSTSLSLDPTVTQIKIHIKKKAKKYKAKTCMKSLVSKTIFIKVWIQKIEK
uniref:Uncharacterized protein n=1 Tax=Manihot esculenta TaxID=3983 RepID=A0A199U9U2_MANES